MIQPTNNHWPTEKGIATSRVLPFSFLLRGRSYPEPSHVDGNYYGHADLLVLSRFLE